MTAENANFSPSSDVLGRGTMTVSESCSTDSISIRRHTVQLPGGFKNVLFFPSFETKACLIVLDKYLGRCRADSSQFFPMRNGRLLGLLRIGVGRRCDERTKETGRHPNKRFQLRSI